MSRAAAALLLSCALTAACTAQRPEPPPLHGAVWIVLDAARADAFGAYGEERPTTPHIDALAEQGTVFERAYAQAAWTPASTASFVTGRYPDPRMQLRGPGRLVPGQSIAGALASVGVRTAAFSENPFVTPDFGYDDGFDHFRGYFPHDVMVEKRRSYPRVDSARTVNAAIAWVEEHADARFFLYVHLLPPHAPYDPPPPFAGRFTEDSGSDLAGTPRALDDINHGRLEVAPEDIDHLYGLYLENLAYADRKVGRLLEALRALGIRKRTLVIVTSDHGEAFGEHGRFQHNLTVFEEVIHVPLVIRFPRSFGELPPRWPGVVELRQIAPTLRELFAAPRATRTPTLLRSLEGDPRRGVALAFSVDRRGRPQAAAVGWRYKLVARGWPLRPRALFDLARDAAETRNVARTNPKSLARLGDFLRQRSKRYVEVSRPRVADPVKRRLQALGYLPEPPPSPSPPGRIQTTP